MFCICFIAWSVLTVVFVFVFFLLQFHVLLQPYILHREERGCKRFVLFSPFFGSWNCYILDICYRQIHVMLQLYFVCECLKSAEIWVLPLNYCCYSRRCWGWLSSDWLGRVVCTLGRICYRLRLTFLSQCPSLLCYILLTLPPPEPAQAAAQTLFQYWGHTATLSSHSLDYCGLIMVTGDAAFMSHGKDGELHRFA